MMKNVLLFLKSFTAKTLVPILAGIPVGIWGGLYTEEYKKHSDVVKAFTELSQNNLLLLTSIILILFYEIISWGISSKSQARKREQLIVFNNRSLRLKLELLTVFAKNISEILEVPCNARYFQAVLKNGETYLYQVRELFVENIPMSGEYGFTSVAVTNDEFVSCRSYLERAPLFEKLSQNHVENYDEKTASTVDRRQRWVLSCPVLKIDTVTGLHLEENPPFGVIVFYGTTVPKKATILIEESKVLSEKLAEQFSLVLELENRSEMDS